MTNPSRLDEIAARAEAATRGPWEVDRGIGKDVVTAPHQTNMILPICEVKSPAMNAEFIAHAREDVPRLVAALRAVEAVVSERYKLWAAICGETCGKEVYGIDHDAIADSIAAAIETAIREALGA